MSLLTYFPHHGCLSDDLNADGHSMKEARRVVNEDQM